jgi:hypothetical protein
VLSEMETGRNRAGEESELRKEPLSRDNLVKNSNSARSACFKA